MAERLSPLLEAHRFLRRGPMSAEGWSQLVATDRAWEPAASSSGWSPARVRSRRSREWVWVALAVWLGVFGAMLSRGRRLMRGS